MRSHFALSIGIAVSLIGCQPLTFAHEGNIDFRTYTAVNVVDVVLSAPELGLPDDASQPTLALYLVDELRANSGFKTVTSTQLSAQTQLIVRMRLDRTGNTFADEPSDRVDGTVQFQLLNQAGALLATGEVSDTGTDSDIPGLQEALLDEVAYYFLRPYRI